MKKALVILLVVSSFNAFAYDENPEHYFSTSKNFTNQSLISWIPVDNVQARCEAESRKRNLGGFGYNIEACSFWERRNGQDICTVITARDTNMHTVGHEIRHCFQGAWH